MGETVVSRHRSYLVRVWTSTGPKGPQWAGRVECVEKDGKQRRFSERQEMLEYLRHKLFEAVAEPETHPG